MLRTLTHAPPVRAYAMPRSLMQPSAHCVCPKGTLNLEKPTVTHRLPLRAAAAPLLPAKDPTISHTARAGRWPERSGSPLPQHPHAHKQPSPSDSASSSTPLSSLAPSTLCPSPSTRPSLAQNSTVSYCPPRGPNSSSQESQAPTRHGPPFLRASHFLPPARALYRTAMLNFVSSCSNAPSLCTFSPAPSDPSPVPLWEALLIFLNSPNAWVWSHPMGSGPPFAEHLTYTAW